MTEQEAIDTIRTRLGQCSIVLVGLMGCGKSSVGKRLASRLGMPFIDADEEIERAAGTSINDIFSEYGESHFREGERKVIARLLASGPQILATGGGAYMNSDTRAKVRARGISVWLKAELPVLMRRVSKRDTRPLLKTGHPEAIMQKLIDERYPVYAEADITVESRDEPHEVIVTDIIQRVARIVTKSDLLCNAKERSASMDQNTAKACAGRSVRVELAERSYDVLIGSGLVGEAGRLIKERLGKVKCAVVTDENVAHHHLAAIEESLKGESLFAGSIVLKPGEATKSFRELAPLCERLLELGIERGDCVIPFGGGVIGDLAGFAAGILRRGVRFVQVPTSLLAQVDSSVGGKTGINTPQGKNLIGVFHQPSLVLADTDVLATLPAREVRAGYAEVVKYGLLGDAAFFAWLEDHWRAVFGNSGPDLTYAIETSVKAKAAIVARDETETGDRALLNLGHTFGHALEAWTGYSDRLLHGEGVAIGMCLAYRLSEELGLSSKGTAERVTRHIEAVGLPVHINQIPGGPADADELLRHMGQDKKVKDGRLTFVLVRGIGKAFITRDVAPDTVKAFLAREIAG